MAFDTIRAFSVRPGDLMPIPLANGQWDKTRSNKVIATHHDRSLGMIVFSMSDGSTFRAFPMTSVPFKRYF